MDRRILSLVFLILFALAGAGCAQETPQVTPLPENMAPARPPLPLPPALAVVSATRLEHKPEVGPPNSYGKAIALGQDVLAVGAPAYLGQPGKEEGTVYIYRREGSDWAEQGQLLASDRDDGFQYDGHFGQALAMQGELLFVGAPDADDRQAGDNTGAVYVFHDGPDGWQETARLVADKPEANARFGTQLVIDADTLVVVADNRSVYLFQHDGERWPQQAHLEMPQFDGLQSTVDTVALYADTLAISVQTRTGEGAQTELYLRVLIYEPDGSGWKQAAILQPVRDYPFGGYYFGNSLALDGDGEHATRLAAGAMMDSQAGIGSGSVLVFERTPSGWQLADTLTAPDANYSEGFSGQVALDGDLLLVSATGASEDSFWDGEVYLFEYYQGRWVDQLRITPPEDGGFGDFFGSDLALLGRTALISAPDEFGNAAYVFDIGVRP